MSLLREGLAEARRHLRRLAIPLLVAVVALYLLGGLLILVQGSGAEKDGLTATRWSLPAVAAAPLPRLDAGASAH